MIKLRIFILIALFIFAVQGSSANDDLVFNLSIQSSSGSKTLNPGHNLQINFSSPKDHLINKIALNGFELEDLSYSCSEDVCNYSISSDLNSTLSEGPLLISFSNLNTPEFSKYHLEIETDYSFSTTPANDDSQDSGDNNDSSNNNDNNSNNNSGNDNSITNDDSTSDSNTKSPADATITELLTVSRFSTNTQNPRIAYAGEELVFSFVLKNKNDDIGFVKIASLPIAPGPGTQIGDSKAHEIKLDLSKLSSNLIRGLNNLLAFEIQINGKIYKNTDLNIEPIKYLSLDADKVFLNRDISVEESTRPNFYNVKFNLDRSTADELSVQTVVLNDGQAYFFNKSCERLICSYVSDDIEILDYENAIKIIYQYLGDNYNFTYKFKLNDNLSENDLARLLSIKSIELPFTGAFDRKGNTVIVINLTDSSEDLFVSKSIISDSNYELVNLDEASKELRIVYKLDLSLVSEKLNLRTNENQTLVIDNFESQLNSVIPQSRQLFSNNNTNKRKTKVKTRIRKFVTDKKQRLAVRGRNLNASARLFALNDKGVFSEISLGKVNKKFRKQLLSANQSVSEDIDYLIYFTEKDGISYIKL